ncbi:hypothetical protein B4U80_07658 [Leptotrombidium deliense]|uniref:Uncharacterized protein n=1 Tax=Leptotrombidium deliense TaxID=299467 RepID=A0A443SVN6_9ACAR|nr:hypothetical protein B4U80_07658 [Leptotrombidium deliense]
MPKAFLIRKKISAKDFFLSQQWRPDTPPPSPEDEDSAKDNNQPLNLITNNNHNKVNSEVIEKDTAKDLSVDRQCYSGAILTSPSSGICSDNELEIRDAFSEFGDREAKTKVDLKGSASTSKERNLCRADTTTRDVAITSQRVPVIRSAAKAAIDANTVKEQQTTCLDDASPPPLPSLSLLSQRLGK